MSIERKIYNLIKAYDNYEHPNSMPRHIPMGQLYAKGVEAGVQIILTELEHALNTNESMEDILNRVRNINDS